MAPVHQLDPYKVGEIRTLGKQEDAKARAILEQVAKQVQPLLRRHQLHVPLLTEFYPPSPNLLGLNIGGGGGSTQEIRIRLRRAGRELDFYSYEHALGTMLHEMCHNHRSPHDAAFYKLLDKYTEECEELMAKGVSGSGAGFDAPAAGKVGGRFVGRGELAPHQRRELAAKAAQERLHKQAVMPAGPRRLGGDLTLRLTLDPRQAAAAAAERRARDNLWCPAEALGREAAAGHDINQAIQQVLGNAAAAAEGTGGAGSAGPPGSRGPEVQRDARSTLGPGGRIAPGGDQIAQQQQQQQARQRGAEGSGGPAQQNGFPNSVGILPPESAAIAAAPGAVPQAMQQRQQLPEPQAGPAAGPTSRSKQPPQPQEVPSGGDFIDLTEDGEEAAPNSSRDSPAARSGAAAAAAASAAAAAGQRWAAPTKRHRPSVGGSPGLRGLPPGGSAGVGGWACPRCTLVNRALALACEACESVRPAGFS